MEKDKRKNVKQNDNERRKWYSLVGFLISIILLSIAIFMSINQERTQRLASLNSGNTIEVSSTNRNTSIDRTGKMLALSNSEEESTVNNTTNEVETNIENATSVNVATENNVPSNSQEEAKSNITQESNVQVNEGNQSSNNTENNQQKASNNNNKQEENKLNPNQFIKPIEGEEISNFSMDSLIYSNTLQEWITHRGIDIKAEKGTEVKAAKAGKVKLINNDPRYGVSITIEHNEGFTTVYSCMLDTADLKEGDSVEQGQTVGHIGNSGVFEVSDGMHLHFEMLKNGDYVNPDIYIK